MVQATKCSKCRPGRFCLSHTQIPFDGTCWLDHIELAELIAATHRDPRKRHLSGRIVREPNTGRYLIGLKGLCFDVIPLRYLDWLSGQDWVYGEFRKHLTAYLTRPCIQRELEAAFPDENDNRVTGTIRLEGQWVSNGNYRQVEGEWYQDADPVYIELGTCWCHPMESRYHRWHGQPMPEQPEDTDPECKPWTPTKDTWHATTAIKTDPKHWRFVTHQTAAAKHWQAAADALVVFTEGEGDFEELTQVDFSELRQAAQHLPTEAVNRVRQACAEWHNAIRENPHEDPTPGREPGRYRDIRVTEQERLAEAVEQYAAEPPAKKPSVSGKSETFATCGRLKQLRTTTITKPVYGRRLACST